MEIEKRLIMLQNTYAASVAETVNTYKQLRALDKIVEKRKERQTHLFESAIGHPKRRRRLLYAFRNLWMRKLVSRKNQ